LGGGWMSPSGAQMCRLSTLCGVSTSPDLLRARPDPECPGRDRANGRS
jgi:hypothetical protein